MKEGTYSNDEEAALDTVLSYTTGQHLTVCITSRIDLATSNLVDSNWFTWQAFPADKSTPATLSRCISHRGPNVSTKHWQALLVHLSQLKDEKKDLLSLKHRFNNTEITQASSISHFTIIQLTHFTATDPFTVCITNLKINHILFSNNK